MGRLELGTTWACGPVASFADRKQTAPALTVGEGLDEAVGVGVVHSAGVCEQVVVATHAQDGAAQLAVLEAEVLAPEVEELLHLVLR